MRRYFLFPKRNEIFTYSSRVGLFWEDAVLPGPGGAAVLQGAPALELDRGAEGGSFGHH